MAYRDFSFPPSTPLYPVASVVLKYLQDYAKAFNLGIHIQYNTLVTNVEPVTNGLGKGGYLKWTVTTNTLQSDGVSERKSWLDIDTVLVTNGRCYYPYLPRIPGLEAWLSSPPSDSLPKAHHSNIYRNPTPYVRKSVIVVGNGPSAIDMAPEIASVAMVYRSTRETDSKASDAKGRSANEFSTSGADDVEMIGQIESFGDPESGVVRLMDGQVLDGIDHLVLATGYRISCPFLNERVMKEGYPPSRRSKQEDILYNAGHCIFPLARHLFPVTPSLPLGSLFFFGLPRPVVPMPLVEAQCLLVAAILSGSSVLNMNAEKADVWEKEKQLMEVWGDWKEVAIEWHSLGGDLQFDYREELINLAGLSNQIETQVPAWQRRIYKNKKELRATWKELERQEKGDDIVRGIGEGGEIEWVQLMDRLIQMSDSPNVNVEGINDTL